MSCQNNSFYINLKLIFVMNEKLVEKNFEFDWENPLSIH